MAMHYGETSTTIDPASGMTSTFSGFQSTLGGLKSTVGGMQSTLGRERVSFVSQLLINSIFFLMRFYTNLEDFDLVVGGRKILLRTFSEKNEFRLFQAGL